MLKVLLPTCGGKCFKRCLDTLAGSLLLPTVRVQAEVIVVANTPETGGVARVVDALLRWQREADLQYKLLVVPERIGYVGACNLAWQIADPYYGEHVAVLNDDLVIGGDWVAPLMDALDAGAAQVGPSLKWVGLDGFWGVGDGRERYQYLEGWCFMLRAHGLTPFDVDSELFDPRFAPTYCEDQDLSIRAQHCGGKLQQVDVPIAHLHSQTCGTDREPGWSRNRKLLQQKWDLAADTDPAS